MRTRQLIVEKNVFDDIYQIVDFIEQNYKAPQTATKFKNSFISFIESINQYPEIYPKNRSKQLMMFGSANLQKAVFRKKWIILFETTENYVVIRRIIFGSLIKS